MRIIECGGSHREIGLTIGKSCKEEIATSLRWYPFLKERMLPYHQTEDGTLRYERLLKLHDQRYSEYLSELSGIAAGSEQSFTELFLVNMRGEYRKYSREKQLSGCSTCSSLTEGTAVIGHNEDGDGFFKPRTYLVSATPEGKPFFCAFCYPGFLPGNAFGFNSEGICFTVNNLQPYGIVEGIGRHFIARSLFESTSLSDAVRKIDVANRASGFNYTVGSVRERKIVNIEVSPSRIKTTEIRGCLFHANHYIELREADQIIPDSSRIRQERGERLINETTVLDKNSVLEILRDRESRNFPILRSGQAPDSLKTFVTAVFDLDSRTLSVYSADATPEGADYEVLNELPI